MYVILLLPPCECFTRVRVHPQWTIGICRGGDPWASASEKGNSSTQLGEQECVEIVSLQVQFIKQGEVFNWFHLILGFQCRLPKTPSSSLPLSSTFSLGGRDLSKSMDPLLPEGIKTGQQPFFLKPFHLSSTYEPLHGDQSQHQEFSLLEILPVIYHKLKTSNLG